MEFERVVEVWRGPIVESVHHASAAVANAGGEVVHGWGDPTVVTYPRSSLKPIQAVALVETGAHQAYGLESRHIALACASHRGERFHVELVRRWLERLGLSARALACGPDYPLDVEAARRLIRAGERKARIYHNCSGKHCGFLTVAQHMGWELEGYDDLGHPAQRWYLDVLSDLLGRDARSLAFGVDNCTLPAAALSVGDMAVVMARFAAARVSSPDRKAAILSIHEAMRRFPEYVSGAQQPTEKLVRATDGRAIMKSGAEGYLVAILPGDGLGIALKIADGNPRASFIAFLTLLGELNVLDAAAMERLSGQFEVPVVDSVGKTIGAIRPCRRRGKGDPVRSAAS